MQRINNLVVTGLNEASVADHRQHEWRHIDLGRTGTQLRVYLGRRKRNKQQSCDEWKWFHAGAGVWLPLRGAQAAALESALILE